MRVDWKLPLLVVVFILCIAPTVASYQPYFFRWDDSDYLLRSITVSNAVWSRQRSVLKQEMLSDVRPPMMTLLGLPWGRLRSWNAAGECFLTLTAFTAFFAALSFFLLLRTGLSPGYFILASVCAFAALGPYPAGADTIHVYSTGFLADSLFAWIAFAAVLLIPYETKTSEPSTIGSVLRGVLWAVVLSAGALTKVNFFYFLGLAVPILFFVRARQSGIRSSLIATGSLAACSIPTMGYWLKFGLPALANGWAASFGHDADFYKISLWRVVVYEFAVSPGLFLPTLFAIAGAIYLVSKRRDLLFSLPALPVWIMLGYGIIVAASSNREIRFLFPAIIGIPYLIAMLIPVRENPQSQRSAAVAAIVVFLGILAAGVPMLHRPDPQSVHKSDEIVARAIDTSASRILLATDSNSLNNDLLGIAIALSPRPTLERDTLAWRAAAGTAIEDDFHVIQQNDLVVFQDMTPADLPVGILKVSLSRPARTNLRVSDYQQFVEAHDSPAALIDGMHIYTVRDRQQAAAR